MADIRIIEHEAVRKCGSFEVHYSDRRPSTYFIGKNLPGRRLRQDLITSELALEQAKADAQLSASGRDDHDSASHCLL